MNQYLLFHTVAELFSIVIAWSMLAVAWNSRRYLSHSFFLFLGFAYPAVGTIDLLHTLAYKGMGVFGGATANLPTQLWVAARLVNAVALLLAPYFLTRRVRAIWLALPWVAVTAALVAAIFGGHFPDCFVEGSGLTAFKIFSEYLVCALIAAGMWLLWGRRERLDGQVLRMLLASMALTILAELSFTLYTDVYGFFNLLGHLLKIAAFWVLYQAIVVTGLQQPLRSLFRELGESEEQYRLLFEAANDAVLLHPLATDREAARFTRFNQVACRMLGYAPEELSRLGPLDIEDAADPLVLADEAERLAAEGVLLTEKTLVGQDGQTFPAEISSTLFELQGRPMVLSIVRNIAERCRAERIMQARSRLLQYAATNPLHDLLEEALNEVETLTDSRISFYHFVEADRYALTLESWSTRTKGSFCQAEGKGLHYPVEQAGVWAECIDLRAPVIHNDYASLPHKKGLPPGHAEVVRELVVPVIRRDEVVAVLGVGNKPTDYDDRDVEVVTLFAEISWDIAERMRAEDELRRATEAWERTFDAVPDLIAILDDQHRIVRANRAMAERLGTTPQNCVGLSCFSCVHGADAPPSFCPHALTIADGQEHRAELHEPRLGGDFLVTTTPLTDGQGKLLGSVHVARDITERKQAEDALRAGEERFHALFESMTEGFALHEIVLDEAGRPCDYRFLEINPAFEQQTGLRRDALLGKRVTEVLPGVERYWIESYGKVALTGEPAHLENYSAELDRWFEAYAYRTGPGQFAVVFSDTTERKRAEEALQETAAALRESHAELERRVAERTAELARANDSLEAEVAERRKAESLVLAERQRLKEVLDMLPAYVILLDSSYHVPLANRFFEGRFGQAEGRRCFEYLFGRDEPCELCETYTVLKTNAPHRWEWLGPDGRNYDIYDFPFTDADGSPLIMEVGLDITEQKQAQEVIRRLNAELEERVSERTAQLEEANRELEAFAYSVSHDLRAPLRHVEGYVDLLTREAGEDLSEKGRRYAATIAEASREMGELIDDLLTFSRMGRTGMVETSVDLDALTGLVRRELEASAAGRKIVWTIAPLPRVQGDPSMLKLVLTNLMGNAVKFTGPRDPAEIELGCAGEEDGRLVFYVRDNGVGFDPQYAHKLFGVFQRLHRAEEFEGTGIGLANVRRIIARHGGRTWAEGRLDDGATFYFTLRPSPTGGGA